ncbi:LiaI-LiaF-like domain-containing protein [Paenibacillus agri]|uniref:DUF4097 family beta strand repeat protein n=1 Tax=Paenibacillus agri TaxID=2744309 RepID=A0A850ELG9_9BACL|nr:DUF4097 family beta strand repeat-containing protein [Paenibacillus agri]NUU60630.1 DUF4097 family beta strand repeat protein [Paenibacillus agri]
MSRWKIGSFTAAIGCIAVGAIIALAQYGMLSYAALGFLWPALLILFGLEMLLRLFIRSDAKSGVSGWAIVLIILLVVASGGQSLYAGGSLGGLFGNNQLVAMSGTAEAGSEVKAVRIELPNGKVTVRGEAEKAEVQYEGSLLLPGDSESEAKSNLDKKWEIITQGDTLVLRLAGNNNWLSNIQFGFYSKGPYLNVNVPQNLSVEVITSDGSIEAFGLQSGLTVNTSNGAMNLHDIAGGLTAHSSNGSITVKNIQGEVDLASSNGSMTLDKVDGALTAKSSNGKITVNSGVTGDWRLTTSNGSVVMGIPEATDATISADTSNSSLKGNVNWERSSDTSGTAKVGKGTYKVTISTSNGGITADTTE